MDWKDAVDWLQLVCWTRVWDLLRCALCLAFPLASFLFTFPRSFFLLLVNIVHQCRLKLSRWSDPCLNVLGASCWIGQTNCCWYEDVGWCLYWAGGLYTWLSISIALNGISGLGYDFVFCQSIWVLVLSGLSSKHIKCGISEKCFSIQNFSYKMKLCKSSVKKTIFHAFSCYLFTFFLSQLQLNQLLSLIRFPVILVSSTVISVFDWDNPPTPLQLQFSSKLALSKVHPMSLTASAPTCIHPDQLGLSLSVVLALVVFLWCFYSWNDKIYFQN